jgi:predicted lactoylglutathione lyase
MLLYVTLGSNDLQRSGRFYDPVMATLGFIRNTENEDGSENEDEIGYGPNPPPAERRKCYLWIVKPYLKLPASWGNGTLIAFPAQTRAAVHAFHEAALANGGTDEGAPGLRPYHENFYAAYVRDPDGNKLTAVCETER